MVSMARGRIADFRPVRARQILRLVPLGEHRSPARWTRLPRKAIASEASEQEAAPEFFRCRRALHRQFIVQSAGALATGRTAPIPSLPTAFTEHGTDDPLSRT